MSVGLSHSKISILLLFFVMRVMQLVSGPRTLREPPRRLVPARAPAPAAAAPAPAVPGDGAPPTQVVHLTAKGKK